MDEVLELCRRVLGPSPLAERAAAEASSERHRARVPKLAAAVNACRALAEEAAEPSPEDADDALGAGLAGAVARELATANAKLPERHREVLALRELLGLSHKEVARAMHTSHATIPLLIAHARLQLHAERRGTDASPNADCSERDRSLRLLASRQDAEALTPADEEWLFEHIARCEGCATAHAAMLEASVNYRAWRPAPAPPVPAEEAPPKVDADVSAVPAESEEPPAEAEPAPEVEAEFAHDPPAEADAETEPEPES